MPDRKLGSTVTLSFAAVSEEVLARLFKRMPKRAAIFVVAAASLCAQSPAPNLAAKAPASLVRGQLSRSSVTPDLARKAAASSVTPGAHPNPDSIVRENSQSSGVTYTCDPTINAVSGVCTYLNGTTAVLYNSTFTNANASIYITFGSTSLGENETPFNVLSYAQFRSALIANEADANDVTAVTDSVPATEPSIFGSDNLLVTNATARALGFSPAGGLTSTFADCNLGTTGCYDGVITISSAEQNAGNLYYRVGNITSNQYDFYSTVEHETDEILGTSSCSLGGCVFSGTTYFEPVDLFRYSSNGARTFSTPGTNTSCASSSSTNACFSLDGVHMLHEYNNLANGEDTGDWATNCSAPLVQDAEGCPGVADLNISPSAEILVLDVVGFNLSLRPAPPTGLTPVTADAAYGQEVTAGDQQANWLSRPPNVFPLRPPRSGLMQTGIENRVFFDLGLLVPSVL